MKRTFLFLILIVFFNFACKGVTETGNPQVGSDDGGDDGGAGMGIFSETGELLSTLCESVETCVNSSEFDSSDCVDVMFDDVGALEAFGASGYSNFDEVQDDIDAGRKTVNNTTFNNCLDAIEDQSCDILGSSGVYQEGSGDYSNVDTIVPDECGSVF